MNKKNSFAPVILSVILAAVVSAAVMIICRQLSEKKYFTVND